MGVMGDERDGVLCGGVILVCVRHVELLVSRERCFLYLICLAFGRHCAVHALDNTIKDSRTPFIAVCDVSNSVGSDAVTVMLEWCASPGST